MQNENNLGSVRANVLKRIERSERNFKLAFFAAVAWESALFVALFFLIEPGNKLHLLIMVATVGSYSVVVLGLVTLGAYINRGNLRLLKAIEMLRDHLLEGKSES